MELTNQNARNASEVENLITLISQPPTEIHANNHAKSSLYCFNNFSIKFMLTTMGIYVTNTAIYFPASNQPSLQRRVISSYYFLDP